MTDVADRPGPETQAEGRRAWGGLSPRRAVAELLIVLGGVLGAFWVEDFRESRGERRLEAEYLGRLLAEIQGNLDDIERIRQFHEAYRSSAVAILERLDGGAVEPFDPTSFARDVAWAGYLNADNVDTATIDEMLSSGNARLLRDTPTERSATGR